MNENQPHVQKFTPIENLSYEQCAKELHEVVGILERGQMSLDEALNYWERGEELAAACERYLDGAAKRIERVVKERQGESDAAKDDFSTPRF